MLRHSLGRFTAVFILAVMALPAGCGRAPVEQVQGYVEGEFVYVASPLAGQLERRPVQRGQFIKPGEILFELENGSETAARDESLRRLAQASAQLEDTRKGRRPSEVEAIEAQLKQARAALEFAQSDAARLEALAGRGSVSVQDIERARSGREQARQQAARLEADLATARLGARGDVVAAAEAEVKARESALAKAQWNLSQKAQSSATAGQVFETYFEPGEWVPAGRPVVALLPPHNIKVRAFVPEGRIATIHVGDAVEVRVDGVQRVYRGKVRFISPRPEYTPPVIYSRESRSKLVFMVEASFEEPEQLHPGQPVDVRFVPAKDGSGHPQERF